MSKTYLISNRATGLHETEDFRSSHFKDKKKEVIDKVIYDYELKASQRMKNTTYIPTRLSIRMSPKSCYIGTKDNGCFVNFKIGVNEKYVKLPNGKYVIAHRDGRYIPLNPMEVIKGFEQVYYVVKNDECIAGNAGEISVIHQDNVVFIPKNQFEEIFNINSKMLLISI